jgi:hypothetical protein
MVHLDLNDQQQQILREVLESVISDLRFEISNTERKEMRDDLKNKEAVLKGVVDALKPAAG